MSELIHRVYLGLGSNLGDRKSLLDSSIALLGEECGRVVARSRYYETEPWGFASEHSFLNGAVALDTHLSLSGLLAVTQRIEQRLGRISKSMGARYTDRPVDIDILFYDDEILHTDCLTVPHPLLHRRLFVLDPLAEIAPLYRHPELGRTILELQQQCHENEK